MSAKLRKGGDARYVLAPVTQGDSFVIPRGFKVREVISDTIGSFTTAPTVTLGTVAPVNQVGTITVANTATVASTVFSIGGVASSVQIGATNTVAQTIALILSQFGPGGVQYTALLNAGWLITAHPTDVTKVVFTGSPAKTTTAPTIVTTSLATQTLTAAVTTNGSVDASLMTSQNMATAVATITDHSASVVSGKQFLSANNTDKLVITFTGTAGSTGYYQVCGQQSSVVASGTANTAIPAAIVASLKIPGYTLTASTNTLTIQNTSAGSGVPQPTFGVWSASPVTTTTFTQVFTPEDTVAYASFSLNALGATNLYVVLQKLN